MATLSEKALEADIKFGSATEVFAALTLALKAIYRLPPDVSRNYIVTQVAIQHQLYISIPDANSLTVELLDT